MTQVAHFIEQETHVESVPSSYFPATQVHEGAFSLVAGQVRQLLAFDTQVRQL